VGEAAETAAGAAGTFVLESRLRGVARLLRSGTPLGAALGQTRLLDPEAIGLIGVGETTGDLPSMLERAANLHSQQVPLRLEGLSRSLHLAMLLFFAVLVAALVLKFFLVYWLEFPYRVYDWMVGE
jgi:type II secretory pathway component PulF